MDRRQAYADLVGQCQFLPGPASSQVGFSIGLLRASDLGALAAWISFTVRSAAALILFAYWASVLTGRIGTRTTARTYLANARPQTRA